jgi:hypothetical protein
MIAGVRSRTRQTASPTFVPVSKYFCTSKQVLLYQYCKTSTFVPGEIDDCWRRGAGTAGLVSAVPRFEFVLCAAGLVCAIPGV